MKALVDKLWATAEWTGSTRSLAIYRMLCIAIEWAMYVPDLRPFEVVGEPRRLAVYMVFYAASLFAFVGYKTRFALAMLAAASAVSFFVDGQILHAEHHIRAGEWQIFGFLALTPCDRSLSVDRWLAIRRARAAGLPPPPEEGPLWALPLLQCSLAALYFYAALDKIDASWTSGMRMEGIFIRFWGYSEIFRDFPWIKPLLYVGTLGTIVIEFLLAFGLFFDRTRPITIASGIFLHVSLFLFLALWPLSMKVMFMYLLFIPPDRVHTFLDELLGFPTPART